MLAHGDPQIWTTQTRGQDKDPGDRIRGSTCRQAFSEGLLEGKSRADPTGYIEGRTQLKLLLSTKNHNLTNVKTQNDSWLDGHLGRSPDLNLPTVRRDLPCLQGYKHGSKALLRVRQPRALSSCYFSTLREGHSQVCRLSPFGKAADICGSSNLYLKRGGCTFPKFERRWHIYKDMDGHESTLHLSHLIKR